MNQTEEIAKSGIQEFDNLIMEYQAGDISFQALCNRLWNTGYKYGRKESAVLSALLTKIEERIACHNQKEGAQGYLKEPVLVAHAKIEELEWVKSLIKQESER